MSTPFSREVKHLRTRGGSTTGWCGPFLVAVVSSTVLLFATVVGVGIVSTRLRPPETGVLLNLALCEARSPPALAAACPTCRVFTSSQVECTRATERNPAHPDVLSQVIPTPRFVRGLAYAPVLTHDPDIVPIAVHVNVTDVAHREVVYSRDLFADRPGPSDDDPPADSVSTAALARLRSAGHLPRAGQAASRTLLKGSSGSSGSSSTRTFGRDRTRILSPADAWRTPASLAVGADGLTTVRMRGPVRARVQTRQPPAGFLPGSAPGQLALEPQFDMPGEARLCEMDTVGCGVLLPPRLLRTRFSDLATVFPDAALALQHNLLQVTVSATFAAARAPHAATALFSFHTDGVQWEQGVADAAPLLLLACVVIGVVAACLTWPVARHPDGDWRDLASVQRSRLTRCLHAPSNDVASLAGLERTPRLVHLNLYNNDLRSLSGLEAAPELRTLEARNNDITRADGLAGCPRLTWADLSSNKLRALPRLSPAPPLEYLDLADNDLTDVRELERFAGTLRCLNLRHNDLTSLAGVESCANLEFLDAASNDIASLDTLTRIADGCPDLLLFDVSDNDLSDDDAQALYALFAEKRPACRLIV